MCPLPSLGLRVGVWKNGTCVHYIDLGPEVNTKNEHLHMFLGGMAGVRQQG